MTKRTNIFLIGLLIWSFLLSGVFTNPALAEEGEPTTAVVQEQMTLTEIAEANQVPLAQLQEKLELKINPNTPIAELKDVDPQKLVERINLVILETGMEQSKDWNLIKVKFALWLLLLISMGYLISKAHKLNKFRPLFLLLAAITFGLILGAEPNSVGMIKDAFVVYGQTGVIFKPRIVAGTIMLLTVLIGGRLFCGWACQFGVLSELMYKLPVRKYSLPFALTNTIRVLFFLVMATLALGYGYDLVGMIDPFKLYGTPTTLILISTGIILLLSVFIYRPFCSMLCPFGLVAWLVEKFSILGIRVNQNLCTNCQTCSKVCPTGTITQLRLGQHKGECYTCNSCQAVCPSKAISYGRTK